MQSLWQLLLHAPAAVIKENKKSFPFNRCLVITRWMLLLQVLIVSKHMFLDISKTLLLYI